MNVLEKAEKAIEFLKNNEGSKKSHELQAAAGTLGRCLGALGSRPSYARHYANLLHVAIPTILSLASNDSAEVRLVGDEALNRAVVGGFAFHAYKTNIILQNQIDVTRNARWIRAALSRVCLGECWVRPGVGKIRAQAQTLFPKLSQIVRQTREIQLIVEALEANLPRILDALAEYTTDEEMTELSKALLSHIESTEPAVRRGVANTVARLCSHRPPLLSNVLDKVFDNLWPQSSDNNVVLGWFGMVRAIFQINDIQKPADENLFVTQDYLEVYQLILHYIEQSTVEHNIQNSTMECLSVLLSHATGEFKKALLEKQGRCANLDLRVNKKGHSRNISSVSAITSIISNISYDAKDSEPADSNELTISGALHLGGLQWDTPRRSLEDLTIQTPDSPTSEMAVELDTAQLSKDLSEKLHEVEASRADSDGEVVEPAGQGFKVNIGSSHDEDSALKYCARLLVSKFILTGYKGGLIPDRSVRVSVKASALNCLSEILRLYPQAMTAYLDKEVDIKSHNVSGASEGTDSNQDNINDFILERNVCFQDSMSESLSQDLFNKSMDYPLPNTAHQIFKKDSRSLEKSIDSIEQKSSLKDVPSHILDSKVYLKNDLMASGISADSANTNANMTNSNITSNSNMTGSNDPTYYPMTSSADVLSSSIDLDMKFDHFGESNTNLDNLDAMKELEKPKRSLKRTDEVQSKDAPEASLDINDEEKVDECIKEYEYQHMSDVFVLLCDHNDPQIRGLVRVCIGNYLYAALELSQGDYYRWRNYSVLPKDVSENINTDKLVEIVLKGLSDEIHSCVNHTLTAVTKICAALSNSTYYKLLPDILNSLVAVEKNSYWLCKVNLCKLYEKLPYRRLFILCPGYRARSRMIMDTLYRMLSEQDHKIRSAAAHAIATITPKIYPSQRDTPVKAVIKSAVEQSRIFTFEQTTLALNLVKEMYFTHDLPQQLKGEKRIDNVDSLKVVVNDLMARLLESSCKFYSQGLLEALLTVMKAWPPWDNPTAYSDQRILDYCLDSIDCRSGTVAERTMLVEICTLVYPVEIHNIMRHKTTNRDIFERDASTASKWQHLEDSRMSSLCEKYQLVVMKFLNVVVHLVEEVSPTSMMNKGTFPGSPVRRNVTDSLPRKPAEGDDKGSLKRKPAVSISNVKSNFAGNFYSEPFYLQFYELLRATHSNHKINLDPKSSIFHDFLSTVLDALAIQLELSTEREFGYVTEELLYYLKTIMPLKADKSVYCVTQLLKCLFGTNMVNQYNDFASIAPVIEEKKETYSFYEDVLLINKLPSLDEAEVESRRSSVNSISSRKVSIESKNPKLVAERNLLANLESFNKNKMDRKWTTNKKELERYIRLFEPVVIQALKSYTMQNDLSLQRRVLWLLSQLLALRVNYCMLDSDQVFIAVLLKQLDLAEQREIPDCVELVGDIMLFLVHLSSSKHHSKQIIELPKLIQLCDGLLASGATTECIAALERVSYLAFSKNGAMVPQQLGIAREVLQAMLCKTMQDRRSLELVSLVLALSQDTYSQMSQLTADTLLSRLSSRTIEVDTTSDVLALERIIDYIHRDVLLEQSRVEMVLKILFLAPPPQTTTPFKLKVRYLATIMVLLRKVLVLIPESEILLSINYLKATYISPQSIFFNMKTEIDPLNVQNVNENCANLSPDVILVRFLFRTLTYAILEMENCHEMDRANLDLEEESDKNHSHKLLYAVTVNLICQIKHMLHLTNGCLFPLTSKTAQTILHNEQSNLNTGLYSWEENIPLQLLLLVCVRLCPMLTGHLSHLLIRLKFLEQKYWQTLLGFVLSLPLRSSGCERRRLELDALQVACFCAYCEYFIENGLTEVVHLTWLIANRTSTFVAHYADAKPLIDKLNENASASGLLVQAIAARGARVSGELALNTLSILSGCHESQSGPLVFLICRMLGQLEPAVAMRYESVAVSRCTLLANLPSDQVLMQLTREDVSIALETLQRDRGQMRSSRLISALTALQSAVWQASPVSSPRAVSTAYVRTAAADAPWLATLVKNRCCQTNSATSPKVPKHHELALLLSNLPKEDLATVMECQEFDRKLIASCFKVACDGYLKEFYDIISAYETREIDKEQVKQQREILKMKEEMNANVDSNKLNVANTLHVFKKSDNKESKSQFFIPISEDSDLKEKFGNLELTEEEIEVIPPAVPNLYLTAVTTLDKSLTDIIRLFPKQNRPLSQSENFDLSVEQTIDRYTKRCHQVFQDKLFYQEFITAQTMLTGFLESFARLNAFFDDIDCDIYDKCKADVLPTSLAKNIALFSMVSLQYLSFLIKNKKLVETQVNTDASLLETDIVTEKVVVDNVICVTLDNVSKALGFKEIWSELNVPKYENRSQSAISCLYAVVKYFVKDTKPLTLKNYLQPEEKGPKSDIVLICDKLLTLIEYWEDTFYKKGLSVDNDIIGQSYRKPLESLLVSLARLDIAHPTALIPPPAWACVVPPSSEPARRVHLPLHALRDLDVLDAFLFRVHLIGWSSKKQFEEIWVALLAAFGGNGVHRAVAGVMQLLLGAVSGHLPRQPALYPMPQLRKILAGTSAYDAVFERVNLERIPLQKDCDGPLYHCAQFNTEFLMLASESIEDASFTARQQLKRMRKNQDIDINSCLQLLIDVATNMLEPKADTGLAARAALITCLTHVTHVLQSASLCALLASRLARASAHDAAHFPGVRARALAGLALCLTSTRHKQELTSVHQNLVKSLSSSSPLLRQAALQGCLLRLHQPQERALAASLAPYLHRDSRISLYEQSLQWTVLFSLVELGHPELLHSAVDFVLKQPQHYCADLVVKGITSVIRQKVLPKELKNSIIEKLLDNMKKYSEHHAVQILMVHLFSADNKLLSPKLATDVSNMDPDVLMSSMERITLLYKVLREFKKPESIHIVTTAIKYFLRETLPPAATLSRVVIEFIESCKVSEKALLNGYEDRERWVMGSVANGDIVFEVFETAISQDQLPVLSGWIFEALCHLLSGKISTELLPYCVNLLLISASANPFIRKLAPLSLYTLRLGFYNSQKGELGGIFKDFVRIEDGGMSFVDRRLLCIVAMHSGFTPPQMERIKELCVGNDSLSDLHRCLTET